MKSVQQALQEILTAFVKLPSEPITLAASLGRTLADDLHAAEALPPFANSAMDGFALRAADVARVPMVLTIIGDIPAGSNPAFSVGAGQAARIMTGAPLPAGADTVIPIEDTAELPPNSVEIRAEVAVGASVRPVGEDVQQGEKVLGAGQVLRPQDLGLLASLGVAQVAVVRKPRVALLSTGDELLPVEQPLSPGKIRDSNSYSLRGMLTLLGAEPLYLGIAEDTAAAVRHKLQSAIDAGADLILSSAGVSVGARDVVKDVLAQLGAVGFWRVNMRPGKPLAFGQVAGIPFVGLPGNPVSSLTTFEVFVRPAILKMLGQPFDVPTLDVTLGEDMESDGRESYIRVVLQRENGSLHAYSTGTQSSGALSSLVKAHALLIIPAGVRQVRRGAVLPVRPFAGQPIW